MAEQYKILFIDDDKRYAIPLVERAYSDYNLKLIHFENLEEAYSELLKNFDDYDGIIIDGKGKLNKESPGDDPKHVRHALDKIYELKGKGLYIPYAILTKYLDLYDHYADKPFYIKNEQEDLLFEFLIKEINEKPVKIIKTKYPEPFQCFNENYLSRATEKKLLKALIDVENNDCTRSSFNDFRELFEDVFLFLHEIDDKLIPYEFIGYDNEKVNLKYCCLRLSGKDIYRKGKEPIKGIGIIMPSILSLHLESIVDTCNEYSHTIKEAKYFTIYSLNTIAFFYLDLLIWLKKYIDEKYISNK